jgi:3-oxoacyl-[acyl-carrier protein] reductase
MQLEGKVAIVCGAAGSMGGAVARAFGAEGAQQFLAGRTLANVRAIADQIESAGGRAQAAEVDIDDRDAVERHADDVLAAVGRVDVSFDATGMDAVQDSALADMSLEDFMTPITEAARRHFVTTTAAARLAPQGFGTIVMLTSSAAKEWRHHMGGFSLGCASIEVLTRALAGEPRAPAYAWRASGPISLRRPIPTCRTGRPAFCSPTLIPRLPRLHEVAAAAVFLASDGSGATTGTVLDLTCGAIVN